jgi:homoserine O-succinyltransferase
MLTIGIVNNMPTAAVHSTERHFNAILAAAAEDEDLQVRWFRFAGARPPNYERIEALWTSDLDGLIVTGAEPRAASLPDEPIWQPLTRTIEWAARRTSSVIWSCLAAHAAVLYLDGVERRPKHEKIFGVFESIKVADHPLVASTERAWRVPHSRWNDLQESDLTANGYAILAKSIEAGVDLFVKQRGESLFLFIQTHPEYDVGTLMREYRRDITRFFAGGQAVCPRPPHNYFDTVTAAALEAMERDDADERRVEGLALLERATLPNGWEAAAVQLYRNWLLYLVMRRADKHALQAMS